MDYTMQNYQEHIATVGSADSADEVRVSRYNTINRGPVVSMTVKEGDKYAMTWLSIDEARALASALDRAARSAEEQLDRWALYDQHGRG